MWNFLPVGMLHESAENAVYICDGCDTTLYGYPLPELWDMGWRWYPAGDGRRWLKLCPDCVPTPQGTRQWDGIGLRRDAGSWQ